MDIWFLVDPLEKLKPERDSTLFLISLLKDRTVYWIDTLDVDGISYKSVKVSYSPCDFKTKPEISFGPVQKKAWPQVQGKLFFRLDPPVDFKYRKYASLLATAGQHLEIINSPITAAALSEKLIPTVGGDAIPFKVNGEASTGSIVKDLWGYGGGSVKRLEGPHTLSESEMAQDFDSKVFEGERRVYIMGEHLVGCLVKKPQGQEFRSNLQWGSNLSWEDPTEFELEKSKFYQAWLKERGIRMATVDFIGKRIIEVNITCPGLIYPSSLMLGYVDKGWSPMTDAFLSLV